MKIIVSILLFFILLSLSSEAQILDGYTDKQSYRAGETVTFFINGFNPFGNLNQIPLVAIDGTVPLFISGFDNMTIQLPTTAKPWQDGFGYSATNTFVVPTTLKSGLYFVGNIPVIIKGDNTTADVVVVCPTNTINAYTSAGGKSLYIDEADGDCDASTNTGWNNNCNSVLKATTVSFHRPQEFGGGLMTGFLRWIFSQSYNVNVIADIDLEDVNEISNSKVIVVIGHSEYWTRQARLNFDQFIDGGKDGIVLSGNSIWWQVRYEDENLNADNTKLTCYRSNTPLDCNFETNCPCCSSLPTHLYDCKIKRDKTSIQYTYKIECKKTKARTAEINGFYPILIVRFNKSTSKLTVFSIDGEGWSKDKD